MNPFWLDIEASTAANYVGHTPSSRHSLRHYLQPLSARNQDPFARK